MPTETPTGLHNPGNVSEHFGYNELKCHGGCGENRSTIALVRMLEFIRAVGERTYGFGNCEMLVDDATRCDQHNSATPNAATNSQHPAGTGADIKMLMRENPGSQWQIVAAHDLARFALTCPDLGGLGINEFSRFVHVDCRPRVNPGQVTVWDYDVNGIWGHARFENSQDGSARTKIKS